MADRIHDGGTPQGGDPDAPTSPEEARAAARLREEGDPLVDALRAAWSPDPLDAHAHAAIVDEALHESLAHEDERALAVALRDALAEDPMVAALAAAWNPTALDEREHAALVAAALATAGTHDGARSARVVPFRFRRAALTATTALALAASVVVWVGNAHTELPLTRARSTQALFAEPFRAGETSARIDRIAIARASDLRDNRFAAWGAR